MDHIYREEMNPSEPSEPSEIYIRESDLATLAEYIAIIAKRARDKDGLRTFVQGDLEALPDLAAKVISEWIGCPVKVLAHG